MTRRQLFVTPALLAHAAPAARVAHVKGESVSFYAGDRLLFAYRYSASRPKTYVHPLCAPDGTPLTLDGPEDHVHHRGLMLAWSGVNGYDFWGEVNPGPHGQIVHQRFEREPERSGTVSSVEHWIADGKVLVIERRRIRPLHLSPDMAALEWQSELRAAGGKVTLSAEGHPYDGLGIRFIHEMDNGRVLNAAGTTEIAKANGETAAWCAYGTAKGTVAIFDRSSNPRYPTPFFVMNQPFGYLSAAPTFRDPFQLGPGDSIRLRYAVVSYAGAPDAGRIRALAKALE